MLNRISLVTDVARPRRGPCMWFRDSETTLIDIADLSRFLSDSHAGKRNSLGVKSVTVTFTRSESRERRRLLRLIHGLLREMAVLYGETHKKSAFSRRLHGFLFCMVDFGITITVTLPSHLCLTSLSPPSLKRIPCQIFCPKTANFSIT